MKELQLSTTSFSSCSNQSVFRKPVSWCSYSSPTHPITITFKAFFPPLSIPLKCQSWTLSNVGFHYSTGEQFFNRNKLSIKAPMVCWSWRVTVKQIYNLLSHILPSAHTNLTNNKWIWFSGKPKLTGLWIIRQDKCKSIFIFSKKNVKSNRLSILLYKY